MHLKSVCKIVAILLVFLPRIKSYFITSLNLWLWARFTPGIAFEMFSRRDKSEEIDC